MRLKIAFRQYDGFERSLRRQFTAWNKSTGKDIDLELRGIEVEDIVDELFDREGLKSGRWDIGFVCTDWIQLGIEDGHLLDIGPAMREDPFQDYPHGWSPALLQTQTRGSAIFGLPYHNGPQCLIYRRELFDDPRLQNKFYDQHERALTIPTTWDDFHRVATFFAAPEKGLYGAVVAAFPDAHNTVYDFCMHLWTRGGELADARGRPTLDTAIARNALGYYRRLISTPGAVHPSFAQTTSITAGEIFGSGGAALMTNWFSCASHAQLHGADGVRGNVAVAPIPSSSISHPASLLVYWVLSIGAGTKVPDLAVDFLRFLARPDMDRITTLEGAVGTRRSTWSDPKVLDKMPFFDQMERLHATARMLPQSRQFVKLAAIINRLVHRTATTTVPIELLLADAQRAGDAMPVHKGNLN